MIAAPCRWLAIALFKLAARYNTWRAECVANDIFWAEGEALLGGASGRELRRQVEVYEAARDDFRTRAATLNNRADALLRGHQ